MKKLTILLFSALCILACADKSKTSGDGDESDSLANVINPTDTFSYKGYALLADLLAGKQVNDADFLPQVTTSSELATHQKQMESMWTRYKENTIDKVRAWTKENITEQPDTVFYPFGGPDFNYLSSFFPNCRFSVLVGIEKAGKLPLADDYSLQHYDDILKALRPSIASNIGSSYFMTVNMAKDLDSYLQGTLPIIMMFVSLHGYEVVTVNPIKIADDGTLEYLNPDALYAHTLEKNFENGFELMYRVPGEKEMRKVCYLSTDLSDGGFQKSNMDKMIDRYFNGKTTFLKAASYLLHRETFSQVQKSLLKNSNMIVSGPSGMPYAAYDKSQWNIKLYGNYVGPIPMFSVRLQEDLKEAYVKGPKYPIPFRFDYHPSANFIVAKRK